MDKKLPLMLRDTLISKAPTLRETISDPIYCLALGFGSGLVKKAPGTAGSFLALIFYFPLSLLPLWMYIVNLIVSFLLGIYVCGAASARLKIKDASVIVWDEFLGLWIALLFVPSGWYFIVLTFLLFRVFDILKPWPIGYLDRELEGGIGIMLDDVAAGLFALITLQLFVKGIASLGPS